MTKIKNYIKLENELAYALAHNMVKTFNYVCWRDQNDKMQKFLINMIEYLPYRVKKLITEDAVIDGNYDLIKKTNVFSRHAISIAVANGDLTMMKWLFEQNFPFYGEFMFSAINRCKVNIMESIDIPSGYSKCVYSYTNIEDVKNIRQKWPDVRFSLNNFKEEDVPYLLDNKIIDYKDILHFGLRTGNKKLIKISYDKTNQVDFSQYNNLTYFRLCGQTTEYMIVNFIKHNNLKAIKYIHKHVQPLTLENIESIIFHRTKKILRWIIHKKIPFEFNPEKIASNGFHTFKFMWAFFKYPHIEKSDKLDKNFAYGAKHDENPKLIEYALAHDLLYNKNNIAIYFAQHFENIPLFEWACNHFGKKNLNNEIGLTTYFTSWAFDHGYITNIPLIKLVDLIGRNYLELVVRYLDNKHYKQHEQQYIMEQIIEYDHFEFMLFLLTKGWEWQDHYIYIAAKNNCLNILQWCHDTGKKIINNVFYHSIVQKWILDHEI